MDNKNNKTKAIYILSFEDDESEGAFLRTLYEKMFFDEMRVGNDLEYGEYSIDDINAVEVEIYTDEGIKTLIQHLLPYMALLEKMPSKAKTVQIVGVIKNDEIVTMAFEIICTDSNDACIYTINNELSRMGITELFVELRKTQAETLKGYVTKNGFINSDIYENPVMRKVIQEYLSTFPKY